MKTLKTIIYIFLILFVVSGIVKFCTVGFAIAWEDRGHHTITISIRGIEEVWDSCEYDNKRLSEKYNTILPIKDSKI